MSTKKDTKHEDPVEEVAKVEGKPSEADKCEAVKREAILFAGVANHSLGGVNDLKFRGAVSECRDYFGEHVDSFRGSAPHGGNTWGQIVDAGTLELIDSAVSSVNEWEAKAWATA